MQRKMSKIQMEIRFKDLEARRQKLRRELDRVVSEMVGIMWDYNYGKIDSCNKREKES